MANFGHFSDNGREYIVTNYMTPRPLMNYLWNDRLLSGVNHFGGGDGSYGEKAASYIDPLGRGRAVLIKNGNRYVYIKDTDDGSIWNPGWYPSRTEIEDYSCRHGLGYTVVRGTRNGICAELTGFVPSEEPAEIWRVVLKNNTSEEKNIKVYAYTEFSLEGYSRYSEYDSYVRAEYIESYNMVYAENNAQERPHEWFNGFIASNAEVSGYETSQKRFLGSYGDIHCPKTVNNGVCSNAPSACERMAGVLEHTIKLSPEEKICFDIVIGAADSVESAKKCADTLFKDGVIEKEWHILTERKQKMSESIIVNTPDIRVNNLVNGWLKQQVQLCAEAGRSTGKGFRDQLQDAWAIASFDAELARKKILETLENVYGDGRCVRGWMPLDHHIYSDGPVWVAPAINAYLKETGDFAFLDEKVKYLDKEADTVWEHMLTVARYSSDDTGEHGLVHAHDGDWNDSLNGIGIGGKGESVWTSIALYQALNQTAEIAGNIKNDFETESEMRERAARIKKAVNDNAWDGSWYLAAFNDYGEKVGSKENTEGKIYLNSQTWAVMTGVSDNERAKECLVSVDKYLNSPYGFLTLSPSYTHYRPEIGRLTGFVPGIWENGTPYCHGGVFKIVSDCIAGRANDAYKTMLNILPDSKSNPSEHSGCEPYALTNMYFGPDNIRAGETSFAWVTGTAGWMFRAVTQYMIGFYTGYDSVLIKPCIPSDWDNVSMARSYRGDIYDIEIVRTGEYRLSVDGEICEGNSFNIFKDGKRHKVIVEI